MNHGAARGSSPTWEEGLGHADEFFPVAFLGVGAGGPLISAGGVSGEVDGVPVEAGRTGGLHGEVDLALAGALHGLGGAAVDLELAELEFVCTFDEGPNFEVAHAFDLGSGAEDFVIDLSDEGEGDDGHEAGDEGVGDVDIDSALRWAGFVAPCPGIGDEGDHGHGAGSAVEKLVVSDGEAGDVTELSDAGSVDGVVHADGGKEKDVLGLAGDGVGELHVSDHEVPIDLEVHLELHGGANFEGGDDVVPLDGSDVAVLFKRRKRMREENVLDEGGEIDPDAEDVFGAAAFENLGGVEGRV